MPLNRAQVENFVVELFRDHRLPAPPLGRRRVFRVTMASRKRLNLPHIVTRAALADALAARLCRDINLREARQNGRKTARYALHFAEWQTYMRGVVEHHFGPGGDL